MPRIQKVLVLGGGSAGFLAAITCKKRLPHLEVTILRSPEIGIIGVGEGTTPPVLTHLHGYLGIDPKAFYAVAQPSWKLGIRFLWGPRPYYNYTFSTQLDCQYQALPRATGYYAWEDFEYADLTSSLMTQNRAFMRQENGGPLVELSAAYHLENETFVKFLEQHARQIGVQIIDDRVLSVRQGEAGVAGLQLESQQEVEADFYFDCSGFRSLLLGETLQEPFESFKSSLFCSRAVVGGWARTTETILPYTTAETMNSGWCWQIEHENRINRGYVYSPEFISDDDARAEFVSKNPFIEKTRLVKFVSGRYRNSWVKNVAAIGNATGFVEPLESTSLAAICGLAQGVAESLAETDCQPTPTIIREFNKRAGRSWDAIRDFLSIHYKFNTRLQTPFWQACQNDTNLGSAQAIVDYYRENGPSYLWRETLVDRFDQFKIEGYLVMLVGQKVPHAHPTPISPQERQIWQKIQAANLRKSQNSLTVAEALPIVQSPQWSWNPDFYRQAQFGHPF